MSKGKKKVRKLTDEQYNEYIATLKNDTAPNAQGNIFAPSAAKDGESSESMHPKRR